MLMRQDYARPMLLAEPEWRWNRRDDLALRLVGCGSPEGDDRAHIPGAIRLGQSEQHVGQTRLDRWDPWLMDPASFLHVVLTDLFEAMIIKIGTSDGTTVTAYDAANVPVATRLW
jgi:3-mercaptopyruvate sulfurtransferase SseA